MLYIIGLGLSEKSISLEALEAIKACEKIYLENYTVEFPYSVSELEKVVGKKIIPANREFVESMNEILEEAKDKEIALLVYGSPLFATTHITLIEEAKKQNVKYDIIYNASILDAVAETGLQLYKFGKIASIPNFEADSFLDVVRENEKINAHSLILVDIGMSFMNAIEKIERVAEGKKIIVCSRLGTRDRKIYYNDISRLKSLNIEAPFCFIMPAKSLHFLEREMLESFKEF